MTEGERVENEQEGDEQNYNETVIETMILRTMKL